MVTFFSPNRNDKFLCTWIVGKRYVDVFVKGTSNAVAHTCVWQQVDGIAKEKHITRHGGAKFDVVNGETIRQVAWAVNLHTIVEDEICEKQNVSSRADAAMNCQKNVICSGYN